MGSVFEKLNLEEHEETVVFNAPRSFEAEAEFHMREVAHDNEDQDSRFKAIAMPTALATWDDDRKDTTCMDAVRAGNGEISKNTPAYKMCR